MYLHCNRNVKQGFSRPRKNGMMIKGKWGIKKHFGNFFFIHPQQQQKQKITVEERTHQYINNNHLVVQ